MSYSNNFFVKLIRFASQVLCFVAQLMLWEALITGAIRIGFNGEPVAIDTVFNGISQFSDNSLGGFGSILALAQSICFIVFVVKMTLVILRSFRYFGGKEAGKMYGMNRSLANTIYLFIAFIFVSTMLNTTTLTVEATDALEFAIKVFLGVRVLYWIFNSVGFGFVIKESFFLALCTLTMYGICSMTLYSPIYSILMTWEMGATAFLPFGLTIAGAVMQIIIMTTVLRLLSLWLINQGKKNFSGGNERAFCWKRLRKTAFFLILVQVAFFIFVGNGMDEYVNLPEYLLSYNKVVYVWLLSFVGKWVFRVSKNVASSSAPVRASKPAKTKTVKSKTSVTPAKKSVTGRSYTSSTSKSSKSSKSSYKPYKYKKKRNVFASVFKAIGKFFVAVKDVVVIVVLWLVEKIIDLVKLIIKGVKWLIETIKGKVSSSKSKSKSSGVKAKTTGKAVGKSAVKSSGAKAKAKAKVAKPKRLSAKEKMILAIQSMPKGEIYNLTAGDIFGVEIVEAV